MIVKFENWQETNSHDTVLRQQVQLGPLTITIEVGYDYNHNWLEDRGVMLTDWQQHALTNPYYDGYYGEYPYYLPHSTVQDVALDYSKQGLDAYEAGKKASAQVKEDMHIALSSVHGGREAFCIAATVTMWIGHGDDTDLIRLATRYSTGIEIKTTPVHYREEREVEAWGADTTKYVEESRQALAESAEETAIQAVKASMSIIRYMRHDMKMSAFASVREVLQQTQK